MHDPEQDWFMDRKQTEPGLGGYKYKFTFESIRTHMGSKARREVYADSEQEAWGKLTRPKF